MAMDLVYVVGKGSNWSNRELRYSLRSVAQNMTGVGRVFVVGENPGFLSKEVTFIRVIEEHDPKLNPAANIISKLLAACAAGVSDDFLLMNDDFIVLQPMDAADVPVLHKGKFSSYGEDYFNAGNYRIRMRKTFKVMKESGIDPLNFGVHIPFPLNKTVLVEMMARYDWKMGVGISLRTVYGNLVYGEEGSTKLTNEKRTVYQSYSTDELNARFAEVQFMAFNDGGLNKPLKKWLKARFSAQSKYEAVADVPETQPETHHLRGL